MTNRIFSPDSVPGPMAAYSHGAAVPPGGRVLHSAGQTGRTVDGSMPEDFRSQATLAWDRLVTILSAYDLALTDIVKINFFLTNASDVVANREVFAGVLGEDFRPPMTLLVVKSLAMPGLKVEIEIIAAKV